MLLEQLALRGGLGWLSASDHEGLEVGRGSSGWLSWLPAVMEEACNLSHLVPYEIHHPVWMACFLLLTAVTFSLFGFIIGLWADDFQKLQVIPLMVMTPLTFLGGAFYSIGMLPPVWQTVARFNPVMYLISGFRWSFYGVAEVPVVISVSAISAFLAVCLVVVWWIFKTGWKLKV